MLLTTIQTIFDLLVTAAILIIIIRLLLSYFTVNPWNPFVRFIRSVADPLLQPFRRVLPTMVGIDFSPLLAIITLQIIRQVVDTILIDGFFHVPLATILFAALGSLVLNVLLVICIITLVRAILTVANTSPFHPVVLFVRQLSNPLVRPFEGLVGQRRDVAPIVAFVAFVVLYFLARALFSTAVG
ncbi:MAG: YggT family protein [Candidatus Dormibacteria bacterium]